MGQVYQHSYCNPAAADANNATEGLFFERDIGILKTFDVQVSWSVKSPQAQVRFILCIEGLIFSRDESSKVTRSPPNDRGWVLQEQLLAPRTVSFG